MLRRLIHEHINVIEEGGHGGMPYVPATIPNVMRVLDNYKKKREINSANFEDIKSFIDALEEAAATHEKTSAYAGKAGGYIPASTETNKIRIKSLPPTVAARVVFRSAIEMLSADSSIVSMGDVERAVMEALGASFSVENGFDQIFGAAIDRADYTRTSPTNVVPIRNPKVEPDKSTEKSLFGRLLTKFGIDK